jgi:predicted GIY-YIG superfamily endonuclease
MQDYKVLAAAKHAAWRQTQTQTQTQAQAHASLPTPTSVATGGVDDRGRQRYIYVLKCAGGKFYVGETVDVQQRFAQHLQGEGAGAAWTKKYEAIEVIKSFEMKSMHDETNTALDLMLDHGIRNVRGGPFCAVNLPRHQRQTIKQMLASMMRACYRCKQPGHCASNCPTGATSHQSWLDQDSDDDEPEAPRPRFTFSAPAPDTERPPLPPSAPEQLIGPRTCDDQACTRCGRTGHGAIQCFARTDINGSSLPARRS